MPIVIKKRVSLDFLGEEYKDSFLTFRKVPVDDYEKIEVDRKKAEGDRIKATQFIVGVLKDYFIEGKIEGAEVDAKELGQLDEETIVTLFSKITGVITDEEGNQYIDPKSQTPSPSPSSTTPQPPKS